MVCIGLCGGVHTVQRPTTPQIPIGFCVLVMSTCLGLSLGIALILGQCECTINGSITLSKTQAGAGTETENKGVFTWSIFRPVLEIN